MKALVIKDKNRPVELLEVADPVVREGQALVRVYAAALNHRDVWIQKGQYAGLRYPIIPGSDGVGIVEAVGGQVGKDWVGKEVIINPALNWGHDPGFQDPAAFRILGLPDDGTLAGYVVAPVTNLVAKPGHLSYEEAAALPLAGVTAYRALLTRGRVRSGERVLISGVGGGVALFVLQFAVAAGARVHVTSGSEDKIARAVMMGAIGGVNYKSPGWVESLRQQAGSFDLVIDGAGGDGVNELFDLASPGGRVVFYGATRGNPLSVVWRRIFWKQLNVLGSTMGSPEDFAEMVEFVGRHRIRPVVDRVFPMQEGEAAFRHLDAEMQFGKVVVKIS